MIAAQRGLLQLCFIRHGETAWSLSGQHTGRTDIPLTPRGEDEARELRPCIQKIQFVCVLTSPEQRARRTCELAGLGPAAELEPDLSEWDYGDYEGQRSEDIRKGRPNWNVFRDGCPRGETPTQISVRADRLIARLHALKGIVALFSHGQFGAVLAARWIGLAVAEGRHFPLGTASLSILAHNPSHPEVRVIELWNARTASASPSMADRTVGGLLDHRPSRSTVPTLRGSGGLTSTRPNADLVSIVIQRNPRVSAFVLDSGS